MNVVVEESLITLPCATEEDGEWRSGCGNLGRVTKEWERSPCHWMAKEDVVPWILVYLPSLSASCGWSFFSRSCWYSYFVFCWRNFHNLLEWRATQEQQRMRGRSSSRREEGYRLQKSGAKVVERLHRLLLQLLRRLLLHHPLNDKIRSCDEKQNKWILISFFGK